VLALPRMALRWGKRPKRSTITWWREEDPGQRREPLVDPEGEPLEAQRPGLVVLGEGGGGVAVKVSRQLVQQQDEGQAPCGIVLPTGELARCGTGRQFAEA